MYLMSLIYKLMLHLLLLSALQQLLFFPLNPIVIIVDLGTSCLALLQLFVLVNKFGCILSIATTVFLFVFLQKNSAKSVAISFSEDSQTRQTIVWANYHEYYLLLHFVKTAICKAGTIGTCALEEKD